MSLLRHMRTHSTMITGALVVVVISTFVVLSWKDSKSKPADSKKRNVSNKKINKDETVKKEKPEKDDVVTEKVVIVEKEVVAGKEVIVKKEVVADTPDLPKESIKNELETAKKAIDLADQEEKAAVNDLTASIVEVSTADDELSSSFVAVSIHKKDTTEENSPQSFEFQPLELTSSATVDDDDDDYDDNEEVVSVVELAVIPDVEPTPVSKVNAEEAHSSTFSCATSSSGDQDINTPVHENAGNNNNTTTDSTTASTHNENEANEPHSDKNEIDFTSSSGINVESKPFVFRAQLDSNSAPFTLNKQEWPSLGTSSSGMDISAPVFVPQALRDQKTHVKSSVKKHMSRAQLIEQQRQNYTPSAKARCNHWPFCTNKNCKFWHPFKMCRSGDDCHFGDKCVFVHPRDCRT
ncbi:hypothetical protein BDB01DRAFT_494749 [Pilobolus umbonatus]|nr:hypothetical protein BDB01DRAFT_494749 [Pilobolus umbonatus]